MSNEINSAVDYISVDKYSSFLKALMDDDVRKFDEIISNGFEVDFVDVMGETPLLKAIRQNKTSVMDYLIENGADLDMKDTNANTPLIELCRLFPDRNITKKVILKTRRINARNNLGDTALHIAAYYGHSEIVLELLKNGADANAANNNGDLPIHRSSNYGWIDVARILIDYGSEIEAKNKDGNTVHHLAYMSGFGDYIDYLEKNTVNSNVKNNEGMIPSDCRGVHIRYNLISDGEIITRKAKNYIDNYLRALELKKDR